MQVALGAGWSCLYVGTLKHVLEKNVEKATTGGLVNSTINMSSIIGALLGGTISAVWGYLAPMYLAAALSLISIGLFYSLDR